MLSEKQCTTKYLVILVNVTSNMIESKRKFLISKKKIIAIVLLAK